MLLLLLYKIVFILTAFGAGVIAVDIFLKKKERPKFDVLFGLMSLGFVGWAAGRFALLITSSPEQALSWAHFLYSGSIVVHLLFLHTILVFLGVEKQIFNRLILGFFYILNTFLLVVNNLYLVTGYHMFVGDVVPKLGFLFYETPGAWHYLHLINYIFIPLYALILMVLALRRANIAERRSQIKWVILASFLGFLGGNSVVPLVYDIPFQPYLLILVPFYIPTLGYAILRYHLFNIKVLTTEIFVFTLWVFILVRVFVSENSTEQTANLILLVLAIVIGIFLMRSVNKEVEQREHIEKLAGDLASANERLKELDQLKSEFVSLATHQIRGPITAIKGYASMILEGDYGPVAENVKKPIETISQSSGALAIIVQDFLDVSRIEQGRMKYEFSDSDVSVLVTEIVAELRPNIEQKGLTLSLTTEEGVMVHADTGKLRQVIGNLIDNSLKYTPKGSISVTVRKTGTNAEIIVSDTGVGIKPETLPKLFQKFSRAEDASKANILGTGLGLYVAKQLIVAQKGTIEAASKGDGAGSTFTVRIPLQH